MARELTPQQQRIYRFIQRFIEETRTPPTLRDIAKALGLSLGAVQDHIESIRRKGFLEKEPHRARGLRLATAPLQIPILGRVRAGPLHPAVEDIEGYLPVGSRLSPSRHFALRVKGDSMVEEGIKDGDIAIVRSQPAADNGDIVVARIGDETTVKRLRKKGGRTILEAANPNYPPIADKSFDIVGVVVEIRRQYKR